MISSYVTVQANSVTAGPARAGHSVGGHLQKKGSFDFNYTRSPTLARSDREKKRTDTDYWHAVAASSSLAGVPDSRGDSGRLHAAARSLQLLP